MKVLVIPEDPTYNGYILKPLVTRLFKSVGRGSAKITILTNPYARGLEMIKEKLPGILDRYRHFDIMLFVVDQDCKAGRADELAHIEILASQAGVCMITCAAVTEIEAWLLAGHIAKLKSPWTEVRSDCQLKDSTLNRFSTRMGTMAQAVDENG